MPEHVADDTAVVAGGHQQARLLSGNGEHQHLAVGGVEDQRVELTEVQFAAQCTGQAEHRTGHRGQAIGDMALRAGLGQCEAIGAGNDEGLDAGDVAYQCVQW
ncbi:hypothetical protein G6F57_012602 [Rhizopus arrhizus]|nr:hypothetical protein G6F22_011648 [Rhizopus arrhizus]KAG1272442.1 hypothetical protein G6F65_011697 [Rhizopus arrhizus]KAG1468441.1 hypothetical protein G6F57_012602 [Rhizopus arrhizus]